MSTELLINVTPQESRVALIENGVVQEILIERSHRRGLVGNIYKGQVRRILPGMQAAFVDIGLERAAFLHASDVASAPMARDGVAGPPPPELDATQSHSGGNGRDANACSDITQLLCDGQQLLVQVIKDPIGSKGARLTTHVSIPACYLVLMPGADTVGISQRIEDEEERQRLREICRAEATKRNGTAVNAGERRNDGYIVRTAAEGTSEDMLSKDMDFLDRMWRAVAGRAHTAAAPSIVHEDLTLVLRTLRELTGADIERIRIDSREWVAKAVDFSRAYLPDLTDRIEHYAGERPIFELYAVEDEIQKALERKVQLKSGGHLVIDQTEAMTTIDVNTGAYVGHRNLEETIFKTNLEAAQAIARQLRLRNLGGIIIIDFIDMNSEEHRRQVLRALEKSLDRDPTKTHISSVSALGLVEMTRKRTRESLEHVLCDSCPTCHGRGTIKAPRTVCYEIFREIMRESRQFESERLLVLASPEVIDTLVDEESSTFAELEAFVGKPITLQSETLYPREQYDVVLI